MRYAGGQGTVRTALVERLAPHLLRTIAPWASQHESTRLKCLIGGFRIEKGRARSEAIVLDTTRMTVVGEGSIDLRREVLSLALEPYPKDLSLSRLALPVRIGGRLTKPSVEAEKIGIVRKLGDNVLQSAFLPPTMLARMMNLGVDGNPCLEVPATRPGIRERLEKGAVLLEGFGRKIGEGLGIVRRRR